MCPPPSFALYGVQSPDHFDGSVISFLKAEEDDPEVVKVVIGDSPTTQPAHTVSPYTEEEAAEVEMRFRNLGYIE